MIEPRQPLSERLAMYGLLALVYSLGDLGLSLPVIGLLYLVGALR